MGVWGAAIFSVDSASDVREDYRDAVGHGMTGPQATDKILNEYFTTDEAEMGVVWLSLAATQWGGAKSESKSALCSSSIPVPTCAVGRKNLWLTNATLRSSNCGNSYFLRSHRPNVSPSHFVAPANGNGANWSRTDCSLARGLCFASPISARIGAAFIRNVKSWIGLARTSQRRNKSRARPSESVAPIPNMDNFLLAAPRHENFPPRVWPGFTQSPMLRRVPESGFPAPVLELAYQAADFLSFCGARSISTLKENMVSSRLSPK